MIGYNVHIKKGLAFAGLFIGSMVMESVFPVLSFIKYLIPGFIITANLFSAYSEPVMFEKKASQNFALLGGMVLFSFASLLLSGKDFYDRFFIEAFLLLAPLLMLLFWDVNQEPARVINICIYGAVIAYVIQVLYNLQTYSFVNIGAAIRDSYMPTETGSIAFVFGLFFIHCFYHNKRKLLLLGIVLFFSFKRINFLAVPGTILLTALFYKRFNNRQLAIMALAANGLLILLLRNFFLGNFDDLIVEYLGIAPNALSMGRQTVLAAVYEHLKSSNWFGIGLGKAVDLLSSSIQFDGIKMLHSDILKNYIEFGPIIFCVWVYFFYRINAVSKVGFALTLYLNILFITDNVSVYFFVMTVFYYLISINYKNSYV